MTDYQERPWDSAGQQAGANAAEWYAWCSRHGWGFGDPYQHRYWTRRQFKAALRSMPDDHPDRWKFETGARWCPDAGIGLFLLIFATIAGTIMSIPFSVYLGFPLWLVTFPTAALVWGVLLRARYRALST